MKRFQNKIIKVLVNSTYIKIYYQADYCYVYKVKNVLVSKKLKVGDLCKNFINSVLNKNFKYKWVEGLF